MESDKADLSSIATTVDELRGRVQDHADRARDQRRDDIAGALYDVERALAGALRRLESVVRG